MTMAKRLLTLLLAAALVFALLGSAGIIICHADHDCSGEDCPQCRLIALCAQTLRMLAVFCALLAASLAGGAGRERQAARAAAAFCGRTPVTLKVKLTD